MTTYLFSNGHNLARNRNFWTLIEPHNSGLRLPKHKKRGNGGNILPTMQGRFKTGNGPKNWQKLTTYLFSNVHNLARNRNFWTLIEPHNSGLRLPKHEKRGNCGNLIPTMQCRFKTGNGPKFGKNWLHTYFQMSITWRGIGISELWLNLTTLVYDYRNMKSVEIAGIYYPRCNACSKQEIELSVCRIFSVRVRVTHGIPLDVVGHPFYMTSIDVRSKWPL